MTGVAKEIKDPVAYAFVLEIMETLGVSKPRELARLLGVAETDEERKVARWVSGANAPDFHGTMMLLRAAGRIRESEEQSELAASAASAVDPLRALAEAVNELVEANRDLHARLRAVEQQLRAGVASPPQARLGSKRSATSRK